MCVLPFTVKDIMEVTFTWLWSYPQGKGKKEAKELNSAQNGKKAFPACPG
jgi:hypothetical protein